MVIQTVNSMHLYLHFNEPLSLILKPSSSLAHSTLHGFNDMLFFSKYPNRARHLYMSHKPNRACISLVLLTPKCLVFLFQLLLCVVGNKYCVTCLFLYMLFSFRTVVRNNASILTFRFNLA